MDQTSKAEQLRLPEQLYILLINPDTGDPRFSAQKVERVLAMSIVWELLHAGAFDVSGEQIMGVDNILFDESYLRKAAMTADHRKPISGSELAWSIAADLHPIWRVIGMDMVAKHLLTEEIQTRFAFFHHRVLLELAEARADSSELSSNLAQAARNLWNAGYSAELAHTHPRLLARLVLLDNHNLLKPLLGAGIYDVAAPQLTSIRAYLHSMVLSGEPAKPKRSGSDVYTGGDSDCYVYDSGCHFWIDSDSHGSGHSGQSHDSSDAHGGDSSGSGHGDTGGCDFGGDSGGDGGGCGGCGGCGG